MKQFKLLVVALIAGITYQDAYGQINISPGDTYVPDHIICTSCDPERLPEVKIVDPAGGGDYTEPADAVSDSQPGWKIMVKNGTYHRKVEFNASGTQSQQIVMMAYPGHKPVFDFSTSPDSNPRINIKGDYITIKGFEIRNGYDGIKTYNDYTTIEDNYVHDNSNQGVLVVNSGNHVIENNRIVDNGVASGACGGSPKHCHGIYFSNYNCLGASSNNTVKYNHITGHGGGAIQFNGIGCADSFTGNTISYNRFEDNAVGMYMYYKVDGNTITHNSFYVRNIPNTDDNSPVLLDIWKSQNNVIQYNNFNSDRSGQYPLEVHDTESANNNVDYNTWKVDNTWWRWDGNWRDDWPSYSQVSGWDTN